MGDLGGFPIREVTNKMALALGVGLLVGLEREFAHKDVGVRSFAIASLLGMLCSMISPAFSITGLIGVFALVVCLNVRSLMVNRTLEITTSAALMVTTVLGVLAGQGHVFTPVAAALLMTMLLAWKAELAGFVDRLLLAELRSAVVLGLLTFVIYPLLPRYYVDPWQLLNPREAWITVIALAGISFVNYILLRLYSARGLYYGALLGGLVNSSAAVTELANNFKTPDGRTLPRAFPVLLLTTVAMFGRNLLIVGIFEPRAIQVAIFPLMGMTLIMLLFVYRSRRHHEAGLMPTHVLQVSSPVSLRRILSFGALFVALNALGTLAQRHLGSGGVIAVSLIGGLLSSASTTAAAAKLASQGTITPLLAGTAAILASVASTFVNLPLIYQQTKDRVLTRKVAIASTVVVIFGLVFMTISNWLVELGS